MHIFSYCIFDTFLEYVTGNMHSGESCKEFISVTSFITFTAATCNTLNRVNIHDLYGNTFMLYRFYMHSQVFMDALHILFI